MKKKLTLLILIFLVSSVFSKTYKVKLNPFQASLFFTEKGTMYFRKGKYAKAKKKFGIALKNYSKNSDALGFLGLISLKEKKYNEAESFFEKSLEYFPSYRTAYVSYLENQLNNIKKQIEQLENRVNSSNSFVNGTPDYMCNTAAMVELQNNEKENKVTMELKLEKLRKQKNKIEQALPSLKKAKFPLTFRVGYAEALLALKKYSLASRQYELAANEYKNNKTFYSEAAVAFTLAGDCKKAEYFLKNSPRKNPFAEKTYLEHCKNR